MDFGSQNVRHRVALSQTTTSGYNENTDAAMILGSYATTVSSGLGLFKFQVGVADKAFGAQNFYTANFPTQYEETRTLQSQLSWEKSFGDLSLFAAAYVRSHTDRFELYRESEGYYEPTEDGFFVMDGDTAATWYQGPNRHISIVQGVTMNALYSSPLGQTAFRVDLRDEAIYSNLLGTEAGAVGGLFEGDEIYSRADRRWTNEAALSHRIELGRFASTINLSVIEMDSLFVLPGADLTMRLDSDGNVLWFGSVNRSVRQPSFTDLYYNLGGAQGSIDLEPELSDNFETGVRVNMALSEISSLKFEQNAFIRQGRNLIDWVRYEGSLTTQAANLREVTFNGMETSLLLHDIFNNSIGVSYTFIKASESSDGFESNYVLDFLRHKLDIKTSLSLPADLTLSLRYSIQDREGGYYDPEAGEEIEFLPVGLLGATLSREFMEGKLKANVRVDNALDVELFDIGNVMLPGRWMRASLTFVFD